MYQSYKMDLAGRPLVVDINRVGKQANGCAFMHYGDTTVLCTATASEKPRDGIDFFPLSVEYEEKMYAVGKIPGGFNKREGKASENAILTSRVIDRPMRPLFPKDYRNDVTLNNMVMSVDPECRPELVAMIGAAIATCISDIPFDGVFIDKIRFPSFANGYEEGFGCFCQSCQEKLTGVDLDEIKLLIHNHDHSLLAGQYDKEGIYHFDHQEVDAFYKQRANIITDYIIALTTYFSSRHLIVGADIYAPFLAYHVGQNTKKISEVVDFIKPMMYRYTEAPAGMRYEYQAYVQHFDDSKCFRDYWDDDPASDESIKKQLEFLSNLPTHVFPGIEINPIDGICSTDQSKLKQNLELFKDYSIISLCWDLMQMDETFLNIL